MPRLPRPPSGFKPKDQAVCDANSACEDGGLFWLCELALPYFYGGIIWSAISMGIAILCTVFIGKGLKGTLTKQSPAFPYPWQKREVEVVGEAIMYKAGGGAQKAISVREIKAIRMTDAVKFEFEVVTSNHSYKFRGSDKTNAFQWVNGLQQLHNRVLHAK